MGDVSVIIADVGDEASLRRMASRAKVVINCCGPYRFYGPAVVKACVEEGTHHVDVSGEPAVKHYYINLFYYLILLYEVLSLEVILHILQKANIFFNIWHSIDEQTQRK